jgi:predicted dehydrogenase
VADLKGAMIGAGYYAGFHAEGWARVEGARIAAVADPAPGRAAEFAARWAIPRAYASAEEMLERERPDFVDIPTRPETHVALTALAASRGSHVICQKPMAPAWEDCLAMVETCRGSRVRLLIHENWRWQPWYREAKRLLDAGALGRPSAAGFRVRASDGLGCVPYPKQPYFREMPLLLVYETLVHHLDTSRFLLGEIEHLFCQIDRVNPVIRGEDAALIQLRFRGGARGLIDGSRTSGPNPPTVTLGEFRLEGDRAALRLTDDGRLFLAEHGRDEALLEFPTSTAGYKGDSVRATQQHLVSCLRSGAPAESEGAEYLKTVAAVFACYRSAETGLRVTP